MVKEGVDDVSDCVLTFHGRIFSSLFFFSSCYYFSSSPFFPPSLYLFLLSMWKKHRVTRCEGEPPSSMTHPSTKKSTSSSSSIPHFYLFHYYNYCCHSDFFPHFLALLFFHREGVNMYLTGSNSGDSNLIAFSDLIEEERPIRRINSNTELVITISLIRLSHLDLISV